MYDFVNATDIANNIDEEIAKLSPQNDELLIKYLTVARNRIIVSSTCLELLWRLQTDRISETRFIQEMGEI